MTPEEAKQRAAELIADNQLDLAEVVAEWLMLQQKEPGKVKPVFSVDWSLLKATQESLREHMALVKAAQESERAFREQVAAALGELREKVSFEVVDVEYPPDLVGEYLEANQVLSDIDATIAALGLDCSAYPNPADALFDALKAKSEAEGIPLDDDVPSAIEEYRAWAEEEAK